MAAIAAVAAVAGAAVGGIATYLGDYELQESQSHSAAKGAARVLQGDFVGAASRMEIEVAKHRYFAPPTEPVITIDVEDEKEIAANVSAPTWGKIAVAKLVVQDEQESASNLSNIEVLEAHNHEAVVLQGPRLHFSESGLKSLDDAIVAMKEITGTISGE